MKAVYFMGFSTRVDDQGYIELDPIYADFLMEGLATEKQAPTFFIESERIASYLNERKTVADESIIGAMIKPPVKVVGGLHYVTPVLAGHYIHWLDA